jgi:hypothetical protein
MVEIDLMRSLKEEEYEVYEKYDFYNRNQGWIRGLTLAFAIQAFIGIIAVEYAFSRLKRFRDGDEERDS